MSTRFKRGGRKWRYRLKEKPVLWDDFQKYWEESFDWTGMRSIVVTKVVGGKQVYLRNRHLRFVEQAGAKRQTLQKGEVLSLSSYLELDNKLVEKAFEVLKHLK